MICPTCCTAADQRAPRDAHCTDPKCPCGHRVERYRPVTGFDVLAAQYARLEAIADQTTEVHHRAAVRPIGEPFAIPPHVLGIYQAHADDAQAHTAAVEAAMEQCRAEFHHPSFPPARCDLPTGHADLHREQPSPDRVAFRWWDAVAMYPTDTTTED